MRLWSNNHVSHINPKHLPAQLIPVINFHSSPRGIHTLALSHWHAENAARPAKLIIWCAARRSASGNAQTVTDVSKHRGRLYRVDNHHSRSYIPGVPRGGRRGRGRSLYHDNLIYLGSRRPLHAGPPWNRADHHAGKHHLLSVLKAATLHPSTTLRSRLPLLHRRAAAAP